MLIPNSLTGTPVADLMKQIETTATARGLFVKREWISAGWASEAKYTVLRGERVLITLALGGAEGKTLRSKSSALLLGLLAQIEEVPVLEADEMPTLPIEGAFLLSDAHRARLHEWNVRWDKASKRWLTPKAREQEALAFLAPRAAVNLGRLPRTHEQIVKSMVPAADRHMSEFSDTRWEYTILTKYEGAVCEAIRRNDTWVSLGSDFPREANDDLREAGARWDGARWTIRMEDQTAAETIIARHKDMEKKRREAECEALRQQAAAEKSAGVVRWSNGSGYGAHSLPTGTLVYLSSSRPSEAGEADSPQALWADTEKRWHVVTECESVYYREDGMSFGAGDDSGRIYHYAARPATTAEFAEAEVERAARQARHEARATVEAALRDPALFGMGAGEYSFGLEGKGISVVGETVPVDPQDIWGGGHWFVVDADGRHLWHVRNNGMDGDDWGRNNIRTGGAGGIGIRYERTPERDRIIELARAARKGLE